MPETEHSIAEQSEAKHNTAEQSRESGAAEPPHARFSPPAYEEVQDYCRERNNGIDPQHFLDYYTANGWTQGKGQSIRDWKAAIRTWEGREKKDCRNHKPKYDDTPIPGITRIG